MVMNCMFTLLFMVPLSVGGISVNFQCQILRSHVVVVAVVRAFIMFSFQELLIYLFGYFFPPSKVKLWMHSGLESSLFPPNVSIISCGIPYML